MTELIDRLREQADFVGREIERQQEKIQSARAQLETALCGRSERDCEEAFSVYFPQLETAEAVLPVLRKRQEFINRLAANGCQEGGRHV